MPTLLTQEQRIDNAVIEYVEDVIKNYVRDVLNQLFEKNSKGHST